MAGGVHGTGPGDCGGVGVGGGGWWGGAAINGNG